MDKGYLQFFPHLKKKRLGEVTVDKAQGFFWLPPFALLWGRQLCSIVQDQSFSLICKLNLADFDTYNVAVKHQFQRSVAVNSPETV